MSSLPKDQVTGFSHEFYIILQAGQLRRFGVNPCVPEQCDDKPEGMEAIVRQQAEDDTGEIE